MRYLIKRIVVLVICVSAFCTSIEAQFKFGIQGSYQASLGGVLTNGGGGGYGVGLLGLGGKAYAIFSEKFAGQVSITYLFRDRQKTSSDLDLHYIGFNMGNPGSAKFSPFIGINSSGSTSLNVGLNGSFFVSDKLSFFLEPKLMLGTDSQLAIAGGFYF